MPVITPEIHNSLEALIRDSESAFSVAQKIGVGHSTVGKWRSGKINKINNANWKNLYPLLKPYLPPDYSNNEVVQLQINSSHSVDSICRYALEILESPSIPSETKVRLLTLYFKEKI